MTKIKIMVLLLSLLTIFTGFSFSQNVTLLADDSKIKDKYKSLKESNNQHATDNKKETKISFKQRRPRWGDEETVTAISHLSCQASWSGLPKCIPHSASESAIYQPIPGWGIVENEVHVESSNNGRG
jgi:hypothetical protein